MHCKKCYKRVEDTWSCCPFCRTEIDKAGGITFEQIQDFKKARKNTLVALQQIIDDLEKYGKLQTSTSLIASGTKIISGILWLTIPGKSVAVAADVAASGLGIADGGMSLFTQWKENGLLEGAEMVCKEDYDIFVKLMFWYPKIVLSIELYRSCPLSFKEKMKDGWQKCRNGKPQDYAYKPTKTEAKLSILANVSVFIQQCMRVYSGNYSMVAKQLKQHLDSLQEEYDSLTSVPNDVLASIVQWSLKA